MMLRLERNSNYTTLVLDDRFRREESCLDDLRSLHQTTKGTDNLTEEEDSEENMNL